MRLQLKIQWSNQGGIGKNSCKGHTARGWKAACKIAARRVGSSVEGAAIRRTRAAMVAPWATCSMPAAEASTEKKNEKSRTAAMLLNII